MVRYYGPFAADGTQLDSDQFGVAMLGLSLIVLLLAVIAVTLWRRS